MRKVLFVVLIFGMLSPHICFAAETYTTLSVGISGSRDSLAVLGNIAFLEPDTNSELTLLLNPGAVVHAIFFQAEDDSITAHYERTQGDTIVVERSTLPAFAYSRVLSFDFAIPIAADDSLLMLDRGNRWYPVLPHGLTSALINVFSSGDRQVFSTGDETTQDLSGAIMRQFVTKIPVYKIPLLMARSGYYRNCSREVGAHEIAFNYFSISDSTALRILNEAVSAFEFYQDMLGEYHHKKLAIMEVPGFEGTNIGAGILMVGTPTIQAIAAGQREPLTLTIASQWFGAGVFCDFPCKGFWFMSLSLSHYLRMLYEGRDLDSAGFAGRINDNLAAYNKIAGSENDVPIIDIVRPDSRETGTVIYSKGPALVHKLRNCVGNDVWNQQIRALYRDYLGKVIAIDDFVKAFTVSGSNCSSQLWLDLEHTGL
ncbi:MAG: hypothetical protein WBP29_04085 [Candidatus Zixiibacteriota bacterium]